MDRLGHLIPPGTLSLARIERDLLEVIDDRRFMAGFGVPSVPTRFVVRMDPSDRAWLAAGAEDHLAAAIARHADDAGLLLLGPIEVEFESDPGTDPGAPAYWAGFGDVDLLVLAAPGAALDVFAARA